MIELDEELRYLEHKLQNQIRQSLDDFSRRLGVVPASINVIIESGVSILNSGGIPRVTNVQVTVNMSVEKM